MVDVVFMKYPKGGALSKANQFTPCHLFFLKQDKE